MEQLHNGYTLRIPEGCFPLSTDSMALSGFIKLPKNANVLDLGAGCATLGLLLCAKDPGCRVTGIEIDPAAHAAAEENIRANGLEGRLESICEDLAAIPTFLQPGIYNCCISNPPYFTGGPDSKRLSAARKADRCSLESLIRSAAWALKYGGDFFLVHRPEQLARICACATANGLEPKRLCLLRHRQDSPVALILLQCRKGGKPGLTWEEEALFGPQGNPTPYYQSLYHI